MGVIPTKKSLVQVGQIARANGACQFAGVRVKASALAVAGIKLGH